MSQSTFEENALFEHLFWLQILGDHSRFIFSALSPTEQDSIEEARNYIEIFDQLLGEARSFHTVSQLSNLTDYAYEYTNKLRCFKLNLLRRHLVEKVAISLPPTFFNHMLNELEEYLRILKCLIEEKNPGLLHPVHDHLLWVSDAILHAETISVRIDPVESKTKEISECFTHQFKELYLKAVEMKGYLRTCEDNFPALTNYNQQVEKEILHFDDFLCKLLEMTLCKMELGTLTPLIPDHMLREECYFLTKLAQVSEVKWPKCDPTKPRIEYAWAAMDASHPQIRLFLEDAFRMSCRNAYDVWQWMVKKGYYPVETAPQEEQTIMGQMFQTVQNPVNELPLQ